MKWIIVSDNHGEQGILYDIHEKHADADLFIHLGDSEFNFDDTELSLFNRVKGNCDFDSKFPNEDSEKIKGITYFYTHGHRYDIKNTRDVLSAHAQTLGAEFAFYGHSHIALCEKINGVYCINPGSISQARGEWEETYAVIDFSEDLNQAKLSFLNRNHKPIKRFTLDLKERGTEI